MPTRNNNDPSTSRSRNAVLRLYYDRVDRVFSYVHRDDVTSLFVPAVNSIHVTRATHVEPYRRHEWTADLRRIGGTVLGPFPSRNRAVAAELDWLHDHDLGRSKRGPATWRKLSWFLKLPRSWHLSLAAVR